MSNGFFTLQGVQVGTSANNRTTLGPFNVPFGGNSTIIEETISAGTTTIAVPSSSQGVCVIPPIGSPPVGVTMKWKTVLGDSGIFISTQQPSEMEWDIVTPNVPANLYLVVAGGSIQVVVQFL